MKRTQFLDARRNIRKELVAFLSIVMIGLLAALAYLGIAYSAATLKKDAVSFFNRNALWDLEVTSTMLMTDEDLEAIRALPGVGDAERVWQIDTRLRLGDSDTSVSILSLPERISLPILQEGRLPENTRECAVEKKLAEDCGLAVGQSIRLDCDRIMEIDPLLEHDYTITGIFHTPDHFSYMVPVTPYLLIPEDSFNREGLDGAFMKTRIRAEGAPEDRYSEEYQTLISGITQELESLGTVRAPARVDGIRSGFEDQIREGEEKLEEARAELEEGRQKLEDGRKELEAAAEKLGIAKDLIDYGEILLIKGSEQLGSAREQLEFYQRLLDSIGSIVAQGKDWVLGHLTKDDWPEEIGVSYDEFRQMLDTMTEKELMDWLYEKTGFNYYREKFRAAEKEYDSKRNDWYYAGEEYLDGVTRFQKGQKELEAGLRQLADGEEQLHSAEKDLEEAKKKLDDIGTCRWVVLDNNGNAGFLYATANSEKLSSLSMSFSSIFLVVGALVIYATISRMVEQQRKQIGVNKALGLFNREIFAKYLLFAGSAVLLGVGLGVVLAWLPMQRAVLSSYEAHLNYGKGTNCFLPFETAVVAAGAAAISFIAVYLGCSQLLRQTALSLMSGARPEKSRRKKSRSSARRSLYYRLILRNMMTDRKRVLVTIVSIAGGCVLLVVGFTLRYGISGVPSRQFGGILTYGAEVFFDAGRNPEAEAEIGDILTENGLEYLCLRKQDSVFEDDGSLSPLTMIVTEKGRLEGYFALRSIENGEPMDPPESGALVPRRFWEYYGDRMKDGVTVFDTGLNRCRLQVAGVFENYYGQLFFLTPQSYEEVFGQAPVNNCFFVRSGSLSPTELQKLLDGVEGVQRVVDAAADRAVFEQFASSLNFVVYLMLFIAGMMACFIVANFTMTFIQRKTGELTVMRINGFTSGECVRYLAADLVLTTVLGTLVGLAVGYVMGARILGVTETPYIQMIREPRLETYLFSTLITFGFSLITNSFALRRIRRLKLTDVNG